MFNKTLLTVLVATAFSAQAELVEGTDMLAGKTARVIFEYHQGNKAELVAAIEAVGGDVKRQLDADNSVAAVIDADMFEQLQNNGAIKSIELDAVRQVIPNAVTPSGFQDYAPYGLPMVQAEQLDYAGGIKVCIVDTGYDLGHQELPSTTVTGDDEGAGPWYQDGHGHGTHVAGTIAAIDGNGGLTGVLGSGMAELHIARVFDDEGGFVYASDLAGAVADCASAGAKVVSMSLGGAFSTKVEARAFARLERAGVMAIAAAGNDGNATHSYPASYDAVVSVAAVDETMQHAAFSQRTAQVELAAPGVDVISTYPGGLYASMSGTSMATPHVSGVAALVWSHFPHCNNYEIRNALSASAMDLGEAGYDYKYGHGLVQAKAAYDHLMANGCNGKGVK
ncbi:S8 family peptidase [Pseudoalteromonas sp. T1lg75]|uniref:S8 family peptidase n=1 Tax=Pseudoalteromonas sp. T1lg75 TaxID=2077102 RepID=UPI000CF723D5|nr:S8 family peptidase [Pseudoalteromonas sp. T1lg75]